MPTWGIFLTDLPRSAGEYVAILSLGLFAIVAPLAICRRWRLLYQLWWPLLPVHLYICWRYRSVPGDALVSALLDTSPTEFLHVARAFGAWWLLLPATLALYALAVRWVPREVHLTPAASKKLALGLLVYALLGLSARQVLEGGNGLPPFFEASSAAQVFPLSWGMAFERSWEARRAQQQAHGANGRALAPDEPMLLVLVIGETVRPDHMSVYGYDRPTTPWLQAQRAQWLVYEEAASTAQWTAVAVPSIVTRQQGGKTVNLLKVFREGGFQTAWFSNQNRADFALAADFSNFPDSDVDLYYRQDEAMLPLAASHINQGARRQLLVLHMRGSHYPYDLAYRAEARRFRPTLTEAGVAMPPSPRDRPAVVNSYDNTIVALDRFLERLILMLQAQTRPVFLMYTSDHGENLLDDERELFMHALPQASRYDLRVPLLFWTNAAYCERWQDKCTALRAHRTHPVSHMNAFPTLLDIAAIRWEGADDAASLASWGFQPRERMTLDSLGLPAKPVEEVR